MRKITWVAGVALLCGCMASPAKHETPSVVKNEIAESVREVMQSPQDLRALYTDEWLAQNYKSIKEQALESPTSENLRLFALAQTAMEAEQAKHSQMDKVKFLESVDAGDKFSVVLQDAPAQKAFALLTAVTGRNFVAPPDVQDRITLNLRKASMADVLETLHDAYGLDYRIAGSRVIISSGVKAQTRIFHVSYLTGSRDGLSQLRVTSGSVSDASPSGGSAASIPGQSTSSGTGAAASKPGDSSKVVTTSKMDFWADLKESLVAIVGSGKDRSVVINPHSGIVVVRAMPDDMKSVEKYLSDSQLAIDREVMLEAKIIEVHLNDGYQSGINWAAFKNTANSGITGGLVGPGTSITRTTGGAMQPVNGMVQGSGNGALAALNASATAGQMIAAAAANPGTMVGLAFQTSNFSALLDFLEMQGKVHVLSSPRIATTNKQKAVLKVGSDSFFVTNYTATTTTGTAGATTTPSVQMQPFFSGVALDVTPTINSDGEIILHVHPSVSQVTTENKVINAGAAGALQFPMAMSSVSETDSVVRAQDGQIVAIGGLMRQSTYEDESGLPGVSKSLFGQKSKTTRKSELVILIKPTLIRGRDDWAAQVAKTKHEIESISN